MSIIEETYHISVDYEWNFERDGVKYTAFVNDISINENGWHTPAKISTVENSYDVDGESTYTVGRIGKLAILYDDNIADHEADIELTESEEEEMHKSIIEWAMEKNFI